jgi:hypothetical protein
MKLISNHNLKPLQNVRKKISPLRHLVHLEKIHENRFILHGRTSKKKLESKRRDFLELKIKYLWFTSI